MHVHVSTKLTSHHYTNNTTKSLKIKDRTSLDQRNVEIGMLTGGVIVKEVTQHFYASESAILRHRTVKDGPRSDRPRLQNNPT